MTLKLNWAFKSLDDHFYGKKRKSKECTAKSDKSFLAVKITISFFYGKARGGLAPDLESFFRREETHLEYCHPESLTNVAGPLDLRHERAQLLRAAQFACPVLMKNR